MYDAEEFILFVRSASLGNDFEIGFHDPVVKGSVNVLSNAGFQKGLAKRRSGRAEKGIVQHFERRADRTVLNRTEADITGQIGIVIVLLIFGHRIFFYDLAGRVKGLLLRNFRIHPDTVEVRKVMAVDKG